MRKGELEERIDPLFYVAVENIKKNIQRKAKYDCADLIQVCSINRGRFGHRPRNDPKFYGGKYPFIQTGDIVAASYGNASIKYTQTLNELGLNTSKLFLPPKLLFTIAANIGDTAILDYQSCFPDSIVALVPKRDDLSIEYLNVYLRIIKKYIVDLAPYAAQRNLNNQQLAKVPVVVPPLAIQSEIVSRMDAAYAAKKQKEAEAQRLLESIDGYLLGELGIELPEQEENTLHSRIFRRRFSEISGGRFDPNTCKQERLDSIERIRKGKFSAKPLCTVLKHRTVKTDSVENGILYIGMENIESNTGELIASDAKESISSAVVFYKKDILFPKLRPYLNKVYYSQCDGICSTEFHVFYCRNNNNDFFANFLRSRIVVYQTRNLMSGNTLPRLQFEDIQKLLIPIPPIEKQTEIANRIAEIRSRAKQLQQEAKDGLEQAKREIETMILGHS